jgi:hypothetical protein
VEVKEQHQVKISSRSGALKILDIDVDIKRAWKNIREYKSFSHRESRLI